ncbi:MAG: hypothetical protein LBR57_03345, partial [Alistipes sp.]|nr:hypothetical protein [Alistipes sp.]
MVIGADPVVGQFSSGVGLTPNADDDTLVDVAPGLVVLEGTDATGTATTMVVPFAGVTGEPLPLYLTLAHNTEQQPYVDGVVRPTAYSYYGDPSTVVPDEGTPYLQLDTDTKRFEDFLSVDLPHETLILSLGNDDPTFSDYLLGAEILVRWDGVEETFTWDGNPITLTFPYDTEYQIEGKDVPLFAAPPVEHFTANVGYIRKLTLRYANKYTYLVFNKNIAEPSNISGAGKGAIVDILAKMRRCLVKKTANGEVAISYLLDTNSNVYADGTVSVLTGAEGDVMVYKPAFYYRYAALEANQFAYLIAEHPGDDTWIYSPASLIGAYKSYSTGSKLYSRSGVAGTASISQADNIAYAKARGTGYNIIDFEQHCMLALLFFAKYGNRNAQTVLGTGADSSSTASGSTNSLGIADTAGVTTGQVSFNGVEGIFGCLYEWVSGATIQDGVWTITNPDGTTRNGAAPAVKSSGWIAELAAALGPYFDVIPTAVGGSATTYYSDDYEYSGGARVLARSYLNALTDGGVS